MSTSLDPQNGGAAGRVTDTAAASVSDAAAASAPGGAPAGAPAQASSAADRSGVQRSGEQRSGGHRSGGRRSGVARRRRDRGVDPVPWWLVTVGILVALYFILPTLVVIPLSFSSGSTFEFPPKDISLQWYENFFSDPAWIGSLGNSVLVGVLAALIATVVGTAAALGLNTLTGRLVGLVRTLLMISLVSPAIVIAVAVYASFLQWRLVGTPLGYVLAHAALGVPFVLVSVTSSLGGFDKQLLRASASLGATPLSSFVRVTLPLIARGIVTGAIFAFVTSFDEVVIALFLRSPTFQTLPVQMYNSVTFELDPTISAASSLVVVAVTLILLVPLLVGTRKKSR